MDTTVPAPLLQRAAGLEPVHPAVFPKSVPAEPGPESSQQNSTTSANPCKLLQNLPMPSNTRAALVYTAFENESENKHKICKIFKEV